MSVLPVFSDSVDLLLLAALGVGVADALGLSGLLLLAALAACVTGVLGLGGLLPYLYPCTCSGSPPPQKKSSFLGIILLGEDYLEFRI